MRGFREGFIQEWCLYAVLTAAQVSQRWLQGRAAAAHLQPLRLRVAKEALEAWPAVQRLPGMDLAASARPAGPALAP